jgi:PAS domain S-box-containing protein
VTGPESSERHGPEQRGERQPGSSAEAAGIASATERVRLRTSEERFRLLVQSVKDYAIFMLDPDGYVVTWNEGAELIKGYAAEEIIGRHFSIFYPPDAVAARFPEYELEVASATGRFEDEGWRVRKDGSKFWANVVITALFNESGELVGFAKVTRDLTERRQAEQRAIEDARRLAEIQASNRAKSEFLTTLSHELRTPLNAIGGYAELLALDVGGSLTEAQRQYLERIRAAQQHLLALVNDLLSFTRMDAGGIAYNPEPVPVQALLRETEGMIRPQARKRGIRLGIGRCPPGAQVYSDRARTQQILLNLLSNALKFTPTGGRVRMGCTLTADQVSITVADTGPGIPQDKLEAIFEPFVQLGRTLTSAQEGVGLGLPISRQLARAMSGDLTVSNIPPDGAVFTLTLPRAQTPDPDTAGR